LILVASLKLECLAIEECQEFTGKYVASVLECVIQERQLPGETRVGNPTTFPWRSMYL